MNNEYGNNPEIPEIPNPIKPERSPIEIWPGRPRESTPVPLEGPTYTVQDTGDLPSHLSLQPQSGGSGNGDRDYNNHYFASGSFPSVDEISAYWTFRNISDFGIGISRTGLEQYADAITRKIQNISISQALKIAEDFIVQHQIHHFLVDRAVASLEALNGRSLWPYMHEKFMNSTDGYSHLEESLSCAYARRQVKNPEFIKGFEVLLDLQPIGYQSCSGDGTKIKTQGGLVTHGQALSTLLSGYAQRTDKPLSRVLGLHGLMLFGDHLNGTNGDLYFAVNGKKEILKIRYSD